MVLFYILFSLIVIIILATVFVCNTFFIFAKSEKLFIKYYNKMREEIYL